MATRMQIGIPQRYKWHLGGDRDYRLEGEDGNKKFTAPASKKGLAKLYTISLNGKLHYVGITNQAMSTRLRYGLKATGKSGYWGYKLKKGDYVLRVWVLNKASREELETIEAEVVFLCRKKSHQWPASQNEIHFHPSKPFHRELASRIYLLLSCSLKHGDQAFA